MKKKKCIAMLLAGGQGTRLHSLTTKIAKPAVSFGSKYRIIDFTLSNCTNSGIDTVGVLTQYEPLILNEYIGDGKPWDLDRNNGGVHSLSPYLAKKGGEWYKGTANAIYQNLDFIEKYDCENVLILSGDHIYKMDYSLMLAQHVSTDADCTIAVIDVSAEEAKRFGIMSYDENKRITDFEEKPQNPKSNHASMGVYIFKKDVLVDQLKRDENDPSSHNDFGKNIIPYMLAKGMKVYSYSFSGYWKDVGTVTSLWEANMDLLGKKPAFDLNSEDMKIYSKNEPLPPTYLGEEARIKNSLFTAGCEIYGKVENSVISEDVYIGKGSVISNSVIMRGTRIGDNVRITYGMIDESVTIGDGAKVGDKNSDKDHIALIGCNQVIEPGAQICSGEVIESL
jgi:glucose-1-phosphate adenylyltransferase